MINGSAAQTDLGVQHVGTPVHHRRSTPNVHGIANSALGPKVQAHPTQHKQTKQAPLTVEEQRANAKIVADVARSKGVDPATAVAAMLAESGGRSDAKGDNGTSFGLFQLHKGGELGKMSAQQAYDPRKNAEVALSEFARKQSHYSDPGKLAAAAQRPKDRAAYALAVDNNLKYARQLLAAPPNNSQPLQHTSQLGDTSSLA
jgi:hypothetical protein